MSLQDAAEIRMVNNIVVHFHYLPTEQAADAVADYLRRSGTPAC